MAEFFLHSFNTLSHGFVGYIVPFLFVLTIVVFFHELGHFLIARLMGVKVLTFSLGFGPELVGFNDRHGTRWRISAIPLGGYVKFFGDDSEASTPSSEALAEMTEEERAGSFHHKKVGPRAAIVAAGPVANFLLAIVIFTALFTFFGKPSTVARVDRVEAGSAAAVAGFLPGDVVTSIDGNAIGSFIDMQRTVVTRAGEAMSFAVKRGDSVLQLKATPELKEVKDPFGNVHKQGVLGIVHETLPGEATTEKVDPATALWLGVRETWFVIDQTLSYIGSIFTGRASPDQIGGPIRIAQISGQVATLGIPPLLHLAAVLSISIGLLNLFPVPLLDGGHLLFYAAEVLRGRPLSERLQEIRIPLRIGARAYADGVCLLQRHSSGPLAEKPFRMTRKNHNLDNVADRQRIGMKMKLHCDVKFALGAKLATSSATNGILSVRRGAVRLWNNKGALRMSVGMRVRGAILAALMTFALPAVVPATAVLWSSPVAAQTVNTIEVQGNRRVEVETVRSYFKAGPGGKLDQAHIDDGLKALIETGLFQDVKISQAGGHLIVTVIENPVIGRVAFEGNKKVKDDQLAAEIQSKPRGTLSRPMVQSDAQRIVEIYQHAGRYDVRVDPQMIEQPNNRVDLIFVITEGQKTGINSINFIGNQVYSSYRLKDVIKTRETNWLSFLASADVYDSDRIEADRDLIRRFYLKHGFADVQVVAALTEYDPERKGFMVTFKIEEGQQYRVASVNFESSIPTMDGSSLRSFSRVNVGSVYNAEDLEKSVEEMQIEASRRGYAFAIVRPRGDRNFDAHTVAIVFSIDEGPRTYIERINIRGNTRTRDYVIRREFDLSEGDAYNRALVDRAERRLKNLDFFKTVKITTEPGSSSDRVILIVDLEENPPATSRYRAVIRRPTARSPRSALPSATSSAGACLPRRR